MHESKIKVQKYDVRIERWFCPNCGTILEGYENNQKEAYSKCPKCGADVIKKRHSRHHHVIDLVLA